MESPQLVDIDTESLRAVLEKISSELSVPFLEDRGRWQIHKEDPLEELANAVGELTQRERELNAAVGIAHILLNNNESLVAEKEALSQKKLSYKEEIAILEAQNSKLKGEIYEKDIKIDEEHLALLQAEEKIAILTIATKKLKEELTPKIDYHGKGIEEYKKALKETKLDCKMQSELLRSNT